MLHHLGCIRYSPPLDSHIRSLKPMHSGSNWEIELRGTTIWCVELIKREIERRHPEVKTANANPKHTQTNGHENGHTKKLSIDERKFTTQKHTKQKSLHETSRSGINAILIDFFLYDTVKGMEDEGTEIIPHHRTRSIWY